MPKTEHFPFTADHIGSEVLERFSQDIYKPKAIVRELVKNAYDSYGQMEHFLAKGDVDYDIEDFECIVSVDIVGTTLVVSDDGLGCDKDGLYELISIALTGKREIAGVTGFRGIGFWSAYTGGESIVVQTTKLGSDRLFTLTLNTKRMREQQSPNTSIGSIMNDSQCVQLTSEKTTKEDHFTKVLISAPSSDGRLHDQMENPEKLRQLLLQGCSIRLADDTRHGDSIGDFYSAHDVYPATLKFQGDELTKELPSTVGGFVKQPLEITVGKKKKTVAWAWYCTNKANAGIKSPFAGIRLFYEGFPLGRANVYSEKTLVDSDVDVSRPDLLDWHLGEVHLNDLELKPDAAGEGLRDSTIFGAFRDRLREFYGDLIAISRAKQLKASTEKNYSKWEGKLAALALEVSNGHDLTTANQADVQEVIKAMEKDNEAARKRVKEGDAPTARSSILRDDTLKKKRKKINSLLKQLEKAGVAVEGPSSPLVRQEKSG